MALSLIIPKSDKHFPARLSVQGNLCMYVWIIKICLKTCQRSQLLWPNSPYLALVAKETCLIIDDIQNPEPGAVYQPEEGKHAVMISIKQGNQVELAKWDCRRKVRVMKSNADKICTNCKTNNENSCSSCQEDTSHPTLPPECKMKLLRRSRCSVAVVCYRVSWLNSPDAEILPKFKWVLNFWIHP